MVYNLSGLEDLEQKEKKNYNLSGLEDLSAKTSSKYNLSGLEDLGKVESSKEPFSFSGWVKNILPKFVPTEAPFGVPVSKQKPPELTHPIGTEYPTQEPAEVRPELLEIKPATITTETKLGKPAETFGLPSKLSLLQPSKFIQEKRVEPQPAEMGLPEKVVRTGYEVGKEGLKYAGALNHALLTTVGYITTGDFISGKGKEYVKAGWDNWEKVAKEQEEKGIDIPEITRNVIGLGLLGKFGYNVLRSLPETLRLANAYYDYPMRQFIQGVKGQTEIQPYIVRKEVGEDIGNYFQRVFQSPVSASRPSIIEPQYKDQFMGWLRKTVNPPLARETPLPISPIGQVVTKPGLTPVIPATIPTAQPQITPSLQIPAKQGIMPKVSESTLKSIVEQAGGIFRGIQKGVGDIPSVVLFDVPEVVSKGAPITKGINIDQISPETVKAKLEEARKEFKVESKEYIGETAKKIQHKIDELEKTIFKEPLALRGITDTEFNNVKQGLNPGDWFTDELTGALSYARRKAVSLKEAPYLLIARKSPDVSKQIGNIEDILGITDIEGNLLWKPEVKPTPPAEVKPIPKELEPLKKGDEYLYRQHDILDLERLIKEGLIGRTPQESATLGRTKLTPEELKEWPPIKKEVWGVSYGGINQRTKNPRLFFIKGEKPLYEGELSLRVKKSIADKLTGMKLIQDIGLPEDYHYTGTETKRPIIPPEYIEVKKGNKWISLTDFYNQAKELPKVEKEVLPEIKTIKEAPVESKVWLTEIKKLGGIRPYKPDPATGKRPELEEYVKNVPLYLRNKTGLPPDEMANSLGLESDTELYEKIQSEIGGTQGTEIDQVNVKDLKLDDTVRINNEEYKVVSKKSGKTLLEDGQKIELSNRDKIEFDSGTFNRLSQRDKEFLAEEEGGKPLVKDYLQWGKKGSGSLFYPLEDYPVSIYLEKNNPREFGYWTTNKGKKELGEFKQEIKIYFEKHPEEIPRTHPFVSGKGEVTGEPPVSPEIPLTPIGEPKSEIELGAGAFPSKQVRQTLNLGFNSNKTEEKVNAFGQLVKYYLGTKKERWQVIMGDVQKGTEVFNKIRRFETDINIIKARTERRNKEIFAGLPTGIIDYTHRILKGIKEIDADGNLVFGALQPAGIIRDKNVSPGQLLDDGRFVGEEIDDGEYQLYRKFNTEKEYNDIIKKYPQVKSVIYRYLANNEDINKTILGSELPAFSREVMKKQYDITTNRPEGFAYVPSVPKEERLFTKFKNLFKSYTASGRKYKTGILAETQREDENLLRTLTTKQNEFAYENLFNNTAGDILATVLEPIGKAGVKPGYISININAPELNKIIELKKEVLQANGINPDEISKYQYPMMIEKELGLQRTQKMSPELQAVVDGVRNNANKVLGYVLTNYLVRPATAVRNFTSGMTQYNLRTLTHFYEGLMGRGFTPLVQDVKSLGRAVKPSVMENIPKEVLGINFYSEIPETIKPFQVALAPFKGVETYWKRSSFDGDLNTFAIEKFNEDLKSGKVKPEQRIKYVEDFKTSYFQDLFDIMADNSNSVTFDYADKPYILEKLHGFLGKGFVPYPNYLYHKIRMYGEYSPLALRGMTKYNYREKVAKALAGLTMFTISAGIAYKVAEERKKKLKELELKQMPYEYDTSGRIRVFANDEIERWLRVYDLPYIGDTLYLMEIMQKEASIDDWLHDILSMGPLFNTIAMFMGLRTKYNLGKPTSAVLGKEVSGYIPFGAYLNYLRILADPVKRQTYSKDYNTFQNFINPILDIIPKASKGLEPSIGRIGEERGQVRKYDIPAETLKLFFLNIKSVDKKEFEEYVREQFATGKVQKRIFKQSKEYEEYKKIKDKIEQEKAKLLRR